MSCDLCRQLLFVHCPQWKRTKLVPGGMAEFFAVCAENLTDTFRVDELRPVDAALIEPLACVVKSVGMGGTCDLPETTRAVIGLGSMGLMHALLTPDAQAYDLNPARIRYARQLGIDARLPSEAEPAEIIFVCPGNKPALDLAIGMVEPGGIIVLFAPMPPGEETPVDLNRLYFGDVQLMNSYSCGPLETRAAAHHLREGRIRAEQVVSDFIGIDDLPNAYQAMKKGEILKAMVVF
jgi:L-iditol 2-dehydrogenase